MYVSIWRIWGLLWLWKKKINKCPFDLLWILKGISTEATLWLPPSVWAAPCCLFSCKTAPRLIILVIFNHNEWEYVAWKYICYDMIIGIKKNKFSRFFLMCDHPQGVHWILCFFLKMLWFCWTLPVLLQQRWCSTCLVCVHTHRHRVKTEKGRSREYFEIFAKKHNI